MRGCNFWSVVDLVAMLDGQTHLVKQGWKGTGHPLKAGGRARPIVIAQKKTLGGIGRDRDESFAFWDQYVHSRGL